MKFGEFIFTKDLVRKYPRASDAGKPEGRIGIIETKHKVSKEKKDSYLLFVFMGEFEMKTLAENDVELVKRCEILGMKTS